MKKHLLLAGAILFLSLAACAPEPQVVTREVMATPEELAAQSPESPKPPSDQANEPPLPSPSPPVTEAEVFRLSDPFWIGRGSILDGVFLPGGQEVAVAWGAGLSLHDTTSGAERWFYPTPTNLLAFDLSPDGSRLAAALADGSIMVFDRSGSLLYQRQDARPNAHSGVAAFSPDGQTLAFQFIGPNRGDPIYLLDVAGNEVSEVPGSRISSGVQPVLVWSADGRGITLASLGEECPRLLDAATGEVIMLLEREDGGCYSPFEIYFPPSDLPVIALAHGGIELLTYPGGDLMLELPDLLPSGGPGIRRPIFSDPDGRYLAVRGGRDWFSYAVVSPLAVWDMAAGRLAAKQTGFVDGLSLNLRRAAGFAGDSILVLYESGEITRWDFLTPGAEEAVIARVSALPPKPWTIVWSLDGAYLAFEGYWGGAALWDVAQHSLVRQFAPPLQRPSLSPDGSRAALFDPAAAALQVYDVRSGDLLASLAGNPILHGAAFSPDGTRLAYASRNVAAAVTVLASGETVLLEPSFEAAEGLEPMSITRLIWSPDGRALVTVFGNDAAGTVCPGSVILWQQDSNGIFLERYRTDNQEACFDAPSVTHAAFNPSGTRAALQSIQVLDDSYADIVVYDLEQQVVLRRVENHRIAAWMTEEDLLASQLAGDMTLSSFNVADGQRAYASAIDNGNIYSPSGEYFIRMMDPPGRGIFVHESLTGRVVAKGVHLYLNDLGASWSPDGRWIASFGSESTVRVWEVIRE